MDFVTEMQTASKVLHVLQNLEGAQLELKIEMVGQGKSLDDVIPGTGESQVMYGDRLDELQSQIDLIKDEYKHLEDLIAQIRAMQDRREHQALES